MPLSKIKLENLIREITDQEYIGFQGFPESVTEAAERWSEIFYQYAKDMVFSSTTHLAAKGAMIPILSAISNPLKNGVAQFEIAVVTYAAVMATGITGSFTGVPPAIPVILKPTLSLGSSGASSQEIAADLATVIHAWMKTGTAINNTSGATSNWN